MENFRPIAMRCTREQFEAIQPKLESGGCQVVAITNDWDIRCYLVNNHGGEKKQITNIGRDASSNYGRKIYEQWDEDIFLKACGISIGLPKKWCIQITEDNRQVVKEWFEENGKEWGASGCYFSTGMFYHNGRVANNSPAYKIRQDGYTKITFEQFKTHLLKQNDKVMSKQKLTVPATDVIKIHAVACSSWKLTIGDYLKRIDKDQNITFSQKEVDDMFDAATDNQKPVLIQIFGKPASAEIDWSKIKTGSKVRIKYTGEVCNGFSDINPDGPVDVVFFNTPHLINSDPMFKPQSTHPRYCTFHQNGKFVLFGSMNETYKNYITEVVEY